MMGVAVYWVERCCVRFMAHSTLFEDGDPTPSAFNPTSGRNLLDGYRQPVLVTDFWIAFSNKLAALLHAVCASHGLVDERRGRSRF